MLSIHRYTKFLAIGCALLVNTAIKAIPCMHVVTMGVSVVHRKREGHLTVS